jgi:hypothetical protein
VDITQEVSVLKFTQQSERRNVGPSNVVTGRAEEAKEHLRHAIELDKEIRKLAIDDDDLKLLWDWIAGLE